MGIFNLYLRAGRLWLAWTVCGVRTLSLILQLSSVLLVIFVADAAITVWQRGDRRQALSVGGSIVFFVVAGTGQVILTLWGIIHAPYTVSSFYMGIVAAMGYELSQNVIHAARLSDDLRESQRRMNLAAQAADLGIWVRDLVRDEIWATDKWRELFGFEKSERLDMHCFLQRLHPEDREAVSKFLSCFSASLEPFTPEPRVARTARVTSHIPRNSKLYLKNLSALRSAVLFSVCIITIVAEPMPVFSHGFAGNRFFPATLATDYPFVANELSLPTFQAIRQPGDQPTKTFDLSADVALKLTPNFGIEIGDGYQFQKAVGSNLHTGFDNLKVGAKYQFLVNAEHETILSLGVDAEIGGTGGQAIGADRFSTIVPGFFFGKGFGDLPERQPLGR